MGDLEIFLKNILNTNLNEEDEEERNRRINPIFENFDLNKDFDDEIHLKWSFYSPKTNRDVQVNLSKIAINAQIPNHLVPDQEVSELLNQLKSTIKNGNASENDLLSYLVLIREISSVFENNTCPYSYYVPLDEKQVKGGKERSMYFRSNKFLFEHIIILMTLLARYNIALIKDDETMDKLQKVKHHTICIDLLREIHALCSQNRCNDEHKIHCYNSPKSISSETSSIIQLENEKNDQTEETIIQEFITTLLGGSEHIQARIHLCTAMRNEVYFNHSTELSEAKFVEYLMPLLGSILDEYTKAYMCLKRNAKEKKTKLSMIELYTRFMVHYWLCSTHYIIAAFYSKPLLSPVYGEDVNEESIENASESRSRLEYIVTACKSIEPVLQKTIHLDVQLSQKYNTLVKKINQLYEKLDGELYRVRGIKRTTIQKESLKVEPLVYKTREPPLNLLLAKITENHPIIQRAISNFRDIKDFVVSKKRGDIPNEISLSFESQNQAQKTSRMEIKIYEDDNMANAFHYGILKERKRWFEALTPGLFTLHPELCDLFESEYTQVIEQIKLHENYTIGEF